MTSLTLEMINVSTNEIEAVDTLNEFLEANCEDEEVCEALALIESGDETEVTVATFVGMVKFRVQTEGRFVFTAEEREAFVDGIQKALDESNDDFAQEIEFEIVEDNAYFYAEGARLQIKLYVARNGLYGYLVINDDDTDYDWGNTYTREEILDGFGLREEFITGFKQSIHGL